MKKTRCVTYAILGLSSIYAATVLAQSNTSQNSDGQDSANAQSPPQERPFEERFWKYLATNNYKNWAPVPGKTADFYEGQNPHGAFLKMYLNRTAASSTVNPPNGSIIIKENYNEDKTLLAITVMYRSKGFSPDTGDWYWVKYNADGSVAKTGADEESIKIAGKFKSCIECHASADGNDYLFFND